MLDDRVPCRNCGAKISSSDAFCSKCGARLDRIQEESKQNKVYISKNMMWVIIAFLAVGALFSYATAIAVNSNPNSGSSNHTNGEASVKPRDPTITTIGTTEQLKSDNYKYSNVIDNDYSKWCCFNYGNHFGTFTAPDGYNYIVSLIYVQNGGYRSISTNPYKWVLTMDGVTYAHDVATYDLKQPISEVGKDGKASFSIVYLVQGSSSTAQLTYVG